MHHVEHEQGLHAVIRETLERLGEGDDGKADRVAEESRGDAAVRRHRGRQPPAPRSPSPPFRSRPNQPSQRQRSEGRARVRSSSARFVPPFPPRNSGPVPVWRGFVGERARTAVYGWSERAFEHALHAPQGARASGSISRSQPELVQRVLLDNAANYAKPDIVKTLLRRHDRTGPAELGRGAVARAAQDRRGELHACRGRCPDPGLRAASPVRGPRNGRPARSATWPPKRPAATMSIISEALFGGDAAADQPSLDGPYRGGARRLQRSAASRRCSACR